MHAIAFNRYSGQVSLAADQTWNYPACPPGPNLTRQVTVLSQHTRPAQNYPTRPPSPSIPAPSPPKSASWNVQGCMCTPPQPPARFVPALDAQEASFSSELRRHCPPPPPMKLMATGGRMEAHGRPCSFQSKRRLVSGEEFDEGGVVGAATPPGSDAVHSPETRFGCTPKGLGPAKTSSILSLRSPNRSPLSAPTPLSLQLRNERIGIRILPPVRLAGCLGGKGGPFRISPANRLCPTPTAFQPVCTRQKSTPDCVSANRACNNLETSLEPPPPPFKHIPGVSPLDGHSHPKPSSGGSKNDVESVGPAKTDV